MSNTQRLFLTGASGLLGRSIFKKFTDSKWEVYGTALTRIGPGLHKVDLTVPQEVETAFAEFKPTFVIHCAAQRFPDKVDKDHDAAQRINVAATASLAKISNANGVPMLYISTDYVFDGKSPPYMINDEPSPINVYGKTKLMGEKETLELNRVNAGNLVLRIPVLYGPVERLSESAVTVLLEAVLDISKTHKVSDYEKRRPSHVDDIASICYLLTQHRLEDPRVDGIFHWCGREVLTKYGMIQEMASIFKLSCNHIEPAPEIPDSTTVRPYDTTLDTKRLQDLLGDRTNTRSFKELIYESLLPWVENYGKGSN